MQHLSRLLLQVDALGGQHATSLFEYFAAHVPDSSLAPFLKTLPVFPTMADTRIAISGTPAGPWSCPAAVVEAVVGSCSALPLAVRVCPPHHPACPHDSGMIKLTRDNASPEPGHRRCLDKMEGYRLPRCYLTPLLTAQWIRG